MMGLWNKASNITMDVRSSVWSAIDRIVKRYENFVGLTEVRLAQEKVLEAEKVFTAKQRLRRQSQSELQKIQERHRELQLALERTPRTDDRFLSLLTEEHSVLKSERAITTGLHEVEMCEREAFSVLSACLRESHEKERVRVERTKYWSIIGSMVGALIGIIGTTVNNERRMRELKRIVSGNSTSLNLQPFSLEMSRIVENHREHIASLISDLKATLSPVDSKSSMPLSRQISNHEGDVIKRLDNLVATNEKETKLLLRELAEVKRLIAASIAKIELPSENGAAPYVNPHAEDDLINTLDSKAKFTFAVSILAAVAVALVFHIVNSTK
ncbi:hypothetical protein M513_04244 [Trichuris suis]|uniref:Coiled-coil domain-containing protein 51 n=2 Tax=Trichuris suis TaxID=68888 RepID=A0A085MC64_9BILA|nr:hypothetical protein M513_04244 [Trichuris suis]